MVNNWINYLQFRLFPATCMLCGSHGDSEIDLCNECRRDFSLNASCCIRCAIPLPENGLCGSCLKKPPSFDDCFSPYLYQAGIADLIGDFKFNTQLQAGRLLATLLGDAILKQQRELPDKLIPVPLHKHRLRQRGYNQSLELAKHLAKRFQLPIDNRSCVRTHYTESQSSLPKQKRKANVHQAFTVKEHFDATHVALLDDVVTTGSTVNELAKLLKLSGIEKVTVWSIARTP